MGGLIPLSDVSRRRVHFPIITAGIILTNAFVFFLELRGGDSFVYRWAVVPANITMGRDLITLLTSMFIHGGWLHIIGNMIFLWAFGPAIEDAMNPLRYLAFYLVGGLVAMLVQIAANPGSTVPTLGASGAVAAVMGAFLVTYPRDEIRVVLIIFVFVRFTMLPAALIIGVWFVMQLFSAGSVATVQAGGVAYLAHVGGAIFGAVTARLFEDRRRLAA